jgi:hypothetical protein
MLKKAGTAVRLVKDYHVYLEQNLGKGQYGIVCKARLAAESKNKDCKVFACKMVDITNISKSDLNSLQREVSL